MQIVVYLYFFAIINVLHKHKTSFKLFIMHEYISNVIVKSHSRAYLKFERQQYTYMFIGYHPLSANNITRCRNKRYRARRCDTRKK